MTRRYPLHRRTRWIISSLEKEHGAPFPWPDAFEHVADLDEKVRRCFEPAEIDAIAILDAPIHCGNADFYVLSQMAIDWYDEFCAWFPNAPTMHDAAYMYASAHSMKPEVLKRPWDDKAKLGWEVYGWRASCGVKPQQIPALMRLLNPPIPWPEGDRPDESEERRGYAGSGWMISELCKMKQDPEFWRSGCPMLRALQDYRNCTLYAEPDPKMKNARWEKWQAAACVDEQKSVRRLRDWLVARKQTMSASSKADGPGSQASPAPEAVRTPEKERGEKSATEHGEASLAPTMPQDAPVCGEGACVGKDSASGPCAACSAKEGHP